MRETSAHTIRFWIILACVTIAAFGLLFRLYIVQIVHGAEYRNMGMQQYQYRSANLFDRGDIFFTRKDGSNVAAASVQRGYILAIDPTRINTLTEGSVLYDALAPYITLSRATFMERAMKEDDPYEELARRLTEEEAGEVRRKNMRGVQVFPHYWRTYNAGSLGAHVLGFLGYDDAATEKNARYGVERYWDSVLSRSNNTEALESFAETFRDTATTPRNGIEKHIRSGDIITTIEPTVQAELERTLQQVADTWHSRRIGGIVMDPQTGALYALAIHPTFDPNTYNDTPDPTAFHNDIVEDVYEMGSIIKPLAMAIGIDEGAVTAHTTYEDTGSITIDGYTIRNYDSKARGVADMQTVLNQSLNVGMAFVTEKVQGERMAERLLALGIDEETGIDLPFEAHGLAQNFANKRDVEYVTASFGQGIALTPIATARALATLGNGGFLVTPHIVQTIRYEHGGTGNVAPDDKTRVFSEETSDEITRMLVEVVDSSLKGGTVAKEHHSIAAKTGTAQIAHTNERGYYDDRYLHSLFGYFPAYEPRFLIFLYHLEPQGAQYASETLTDPFMHLTDFLIHYYEVPPDR
jgi:cell division protein FtsI/penicillin-binding protein 2